MHINISLTHRAIPYVAFVFLQFFSLFTKLYYLLFSIPHFSLDATVTVAHPIRAITKRMPIKGGTLRKSAFNTCYYYGRRLRRTSLAKFCLHWGRGNRKWGREDWPSCLLSPCTKKQGTYSMPQKDEINKY